jgi:hypothetical protein
VGLRGARIGDENAFEARLGLTWSVALGEPAGQPAPREGSLPFRRE